MKIEQTDAARYVINVKHSQTMTFRGTTATSLPTVVRAPWAANLVGQLLVRVVSVE